MSNEWVYTVYLGLCTVCVLDNMCPWSWSGCLVNVCRVAVVQVNWTEARQWWRKVTFVYCQNKMQLLSTKLFTVVCLKNNATTKKRRIRPLCRVLLNVFFAITSFCSYVLCCLKVCEWAYIPIPFNLFLVCLSYTIVVIFDTKAHYCFILNFLYDLFLCLFSWPLVKTIDVVLCQQINGSCFVSDQLSFTGLSRRNAV